MPSHPTSSARFNTRAVSTAALPLWLRTLGTAAALILLILLFFACQGSARQTQLKNPDFLQQGDKIALISPSYYETPENISQAAQVLRAAGFEPVIAPNTGNPYRRVYAGTPQERLEDLRWALADPAIKAVISNRGGYGTIQLLPKLKLQDFAQHPKWFIGFSDSTTLLGLQNRAGLMSIHGPMSRTIATHPQDHSTNLLLDLLKGRVPRYALPPHPGNLKGRAQGVLVGGNLSTLCANLGSIADPTALSPALILFIEDIEETARNLDRLLCMLALQGVLARCRGVILGDFTACESDFDYTSAEALIRDHVKALGIPLMCGFPAGHERVNLPLVMGSQVTLEVGDDGALLEFDLGSETAQVYTASETH